MLRPYVVFPHAEGGTRTPTSLRPLAPEASASTSSTTSASSARMIESEKSEVKPKLGESGLLSLSRTTRDLAVREAAFCRRGGEVQRCHRIARSCFSLEHA